MSDVLREQVGVDAEAIAGAVDAAVGYARNPLPDVNRCEVLRKVAAALRERRDELARLMVEEVRKPVTLGRLEVERSAEVVAWTASEWETLRGELSPTHASESGQGRLVLVTRDPIGVVCAITPFNFPVGLGVHKIAPALVSGNACVVKPSEYTPRTMALLCSLFIECGFPATSLQSVPGGAEVVDALLEHPGVGLYSFTGSPRVGRKIKSRSGLRPVVLELGANCATIVHEDADLARAAAALARGAFAFAGQACFSVQRIIVHERVHDEFLARFAEEAASLPIGEPTDAAVLVGPMINEDAVRRVEALVRAAVEEGAVLVAGGEAEGLLLPPTILDGVSQKSSVWNEEAFGPVAAVAHYRSLNEGINLANDSRFGLQTGIYTASVATALEAAGRLRTGAVLVNEPSSWRATPMPFGGIRDSGFGREGPRYAIESMTVQKTIGLMP